MDRELGKDGLHSLLVRAIWCLEDSIIRNLENISFLHSLGGHVMENG